MADAAGAQSAVEEVAAATAGAAAGAATTTTGAGDAGGAASGGTNGTAGSGEKSGGTESNGTEKTDATPERGNGRGAEDRIRELTGRLHHSTRAQDQMRRELDELKSGGGKRPSAEEHRKAWQERLANDPASVYDLIAEAKEMARREALGDFQGHQQQQALAKDVAKARKFLYRQPESEHDEYEARIKAIQNEHPEFEDMPMDEVLAETIAEYRRKHGTAKGAEKATEKTPDKANNAAADRIAKELATGSGRGTGSDTAGGKTFFMADIQELAAKNPGKFREMEAEIDRAMEAGRVKAGKGPGLL